MKPRDHFISPRVETERLQALWANWMQQLYSPAASLARASAAWTPRANLSAAVRCRRSISAGCSSTRACSAASSRRRVAAHVSFGKQTSKPDFSLTVWAQGLMETNPGAAFELRVNCVQLIQAPHRCVDTSCSIRRHSSPSPNSFSAIIPASSWLRPAHRPAREGWHSRGGSDWLHTGCHQSGS